MSMPILSTSRKTRSLSSHLAKVSSTDQYSNPKYLPSSALRLPRVSLRLPRISLRVTTRRLTREAWLRLQEENRMVRQAKGWEDLYKVLVVHFRHICDYEITSPIVTSGRTNELLQFALHQGAADIQAVKMSSQYNDTAPRWSRVRSSDTPALHCPMHLPGGNCMWYTVPNTILRYPLGRREGLT